MTFTTYAELISEVQDGVNDIRMTDSAVKTCIRLAEDTLFANFASRLDIVSANLSAVAGRAALPSDYRTHVDLRRARIPLEYKAPLRFAEWQETTSLPNYWTIIGNELVLSSDVDIDLSFTYRADPPHLSDSVPSNWLLTKWPSLYYYSTLSRAGTYLFDDAQAAQWDGRYQAALEEIIKADNRNNGGAGRVAASHWVV